MPTSARRARVARARESVAGAKRRRLTRLGRREVRLLCGAGLEGAAGRRAQATQALEGANGVSDRSAQRAVRVLAAGALEEFADDPQSTIYKQTAEITERPTPLPQTTI